MKSLDFLDLVIVRTPVFPVNKITDQKLLEEGIYLASSQLHKEYYKYQQNQIASLKDIAKLKSSLFKYSNRARYRCTPFGLFAGIQECEFADQNSIKYKPDLTSGLKRKTHLNFLFLNELVKHILKKEPLKKHLKFYPNTSIYKTGDHYQYIEHYFEQKKQLYKLSKVDYSEYLELIFTESKKGATILQLSAHLIDDELSSDEVKHFLNELIESQLLISEIEPAIIGEDFLDVLTKRLIDINTKEQSEEISLLISALTSIKAGLQKIDDNVKNPQEAYDAILQIIKQIFPNTAEEKLFQTDLYKDSQTSFIDKAIKKNISEAVSFLTKITPVYENQNLANFKNRFQKKFEDKEVSLLKALDSEIGIGYPFNNQGAINELIENIDFNSSLSNQSLSWGALSQKLNSLVQNAQRNGQKIIELREEDFTGLMNEDKGLPHSLSILFNVVNTETNKIAIRNIGGSSAINLVSRLALNGTKLHQTMETIVNHESKQAPDFITAEIVHLPELRLGHIASHPSLRKYEIPYLSPASVNQSQQIDLSDLYVSIRDNKIILRSKTLNKEIIPRLSNAHNFSNSMLPVYRFLGDMQNHYFAKPYINFNWGALTAIYSFLPRVEYKNSILSPATWNFMEDELKLFLDGNKQTGPEDLFNEFKRRFNLPESFLIIEGDNELFIDSGNEQAAQVFFDSIKSQHKICIQEFLFDLDRSLVSDSDGNVYTNECMAFALNHENKITSKPLNHPEIFKSTRHFPPGSDWLYLKIFCGINNTDTLLTEQVHFIKTKLLETRSIDRWFFIRYSDPEQQLRLRFHLRDLNKLSEILNLINEYFEPLLKEGIISKYYLDTYERELERYGDNSIELAEDFFYHDSEACLQALMVFNDQQNQTLRWQYALKSLDHVLDAFQFTLEAKYGLLKKLRGSFLTEHSDTKIIKRQIDENFRKYRKEIQQVLSRDWEFEGLISPLLEERTAKSKIMVENILSLHAGHKLQVNFEELISSYIHMMLNRIFLSKPRLNELLVYDFMSRHYKSGMEKQKLSFPA